MRAGLLAAIGSAVLATGCLVSVRQVSDPGPAFRAARAEAESLAERTGPAHSVHVLVYDPGDRELVEASVPLWLARKVAGQADRGIPYGDDHGDRAERALRGRITLGELERAGRGALVEVEEADGEQVLVWLK